MGNLTTFQIVVIGLCVAFLIVGVGVFAAFGGLLGGSRVGPVRVWGTVDSGVMSNLLSTLHSSDSALEAVTYIQKEPLTYNQTLLNAMAAGAGPDLFLVSQDNLQSFADKIIPVSYNVVSQAQFTSSFVDEGSLFLIPQGSLALPFMLDPLVLYWNRDLFASVGLGQAPAFWNDFLTIAPKITSFSGGRTVSKSAVALGQWQNVTNAKAVLSTLFMQTGDQIVARGTDGAPLPVFGQTPEQAASNPAESALRFYTEFANPSKTTYSWNASLPKSSGAFTSGDLGVYFGFASEYLAIAARNPNLHFSVALMPQLQGNSAHLTFGQITGLAISRSAANPQGALAVAQSLTNQRASSALTTALFLPPARRDVVVDASNNAAMQTFAQSSLIAHGWLDPAPAQTDALFKTMIESVVSGAQLPAGAVAEGAQALQLLFSRQ
ncbi:MAG: extracellular solute-binding protein [bacterium]|nr:extracellular solute-binding protein [bacterium]